MSASICTKNFATCSSSAPSPLYNRNATYAPEDILNVCRAEDDEQKRRIADAEGENHKRVLANNLSVMLGEDLRPTWFSRGTSFVLSLLSIARSTASRSASNLGATVASKAGEAAHQISSSVSSQAHAAAHNIKEKSFETAHSVSSLAQEKAVDLKDKGLETAQEAQSWFSGKTHEYTQWLKDTVANMTLYKKLGSLTGHSNMTFAMLEEEGERAFRMNSSSEKYAIQNALKVAALIKQLNPELNRTSSDSNIHYETRLLEERERSFRMNSSSESFAIKNAMKLASFIKELSPALYRPGCEPNPHYASRLLEERERSARMNSSSEECAIQNALELAALVKDLHPALYRQSSYPSTHFATRLMEEAERSRRVCEDKVGLSNAKAVSSLVNQKFSRDLEQKNAAAKKADIKVEAPVEEVKRPRPYTAAM